MTTPTPGWGDTSGQSPFDPTHTSPSYGPGYVSPSYDPGYSAPTYVSPSYEPGPPASYGSPNQYGAGQSQVPAYGQPQPYPEQTYYAPQEPPYVPDNPYGNYYQMAPAPGYGLSPYPMMPLQNLPTGMAVAAMVCGIVGTVLGICGWLIPVPIVGIVLGSLALQKANRGQAGGRGMAITGIITGGIGAALSALFLLIYLIGMAS